jgi:hypothetical protein
MYALAGFDLTTHKLSSLDETSALCRQRAVFICMYGHEAYSFLEVDRAMA